MAARKMDPAWIGAFVVGALAIAIGAVVLWGSGRLFRQTAKFVCYFDGSVQGLEVGAPVKARGVPVGVVTRIQLRYRERPSDDRIPVFIEVDLGRMVDLGGQSPDPKLLRELINRGLRARLETQSFVTGALFINFGQYPDSPIRLSELDPARGYPEIPTVRRPFAEIGEAVTSIVNRVEKLDVEGIANAISGAAGSIERLATTGKLPDALSELEATISSYKRLGRHLDAGVDPLLAELRSTVADARKALVGLGGAAGATSRLMAPEASLSVRLNDSLDEVGRAAAAVRELAEYLQRNPNALLVGKTR